MPDQQPTNKQLVEQLQALHVENVNPNANKATLTAMLSEAQKKQQSANKPVQQPSTNSDVQNILNAIGQVATSVEELNKRVTKIEDGGKNDFMNEVKQSDVDSATESKAKQDPRIVAIVEEILGIDFGVEVVPNPNSPGFNFTVLVPKRLSPIPSSTRPILDTETNQYKKDAKTGQVVEETYWPGDRRSRAIGSTDSFDLIRDHCNKVRAHIVTYYEKLKKPLPEFKLK